MSGPSWLMKLALALIIEAEAHIVAEGVAAPAEEDREDTSVTF